MPRSYAKTNTVIREVVQSEFNNGLSSRAYVESYDGYGGQGDILSKFGIQGLDDLEITISRERFESYASPLMKDLPDMGSPIDLKRVILFGSLLGIDYLKLSLLNTNNLSTNLKRDMFIN